MSPHSHQSCVCVCEWVVPVSCLSNCLGLHSFPGMPPTTLCRSLPFHHHSHLETSPLTDFPSRRLFCPFVPCLKTAEELVRLPGCFLCYTPAADAPPVAPLPAAAAGFVTFGSFNALAKQTPEVMVGEVGRGWVVSAMGVRVVVVVNRAQC